MSMQEEVLVIPRSQFIAAGEFHGFRPYDDTYRRKLLDPAGMSYRPRSEVETDPGFKQLIPYVVLTCGDDVFHYVRGSAGTEKRLQARRSVGIGGHISRTDAIDGGDPYRNGMKRELAEEVEIQSAYREEFLGFIYDGRTPVGEVHLGIVHLLVLEEPLVWPRESAIDDTGFATAPELLRIRDDFETWSQFALDELLRR